jgi:hypothetical protein
VPSFDERTRTETYYEILMAKPASAGELSRAQAVMRQKLASAGKGTGNDDAFWVDNDDDNIILRARMD